MAAPGYGKKSAPDQSPRDRQTFAHLPEREAHIAAHIDRLPDGAAIDVKTLAKELAAYGQHAIRTALNALTAAGHVFRKRETVGEGRTQWVWRSYFSRTPRSEAWWKRFLKGDAPEPQPEPAAAPPSEAYEALAVVARTNPRLPLSAAECADLEPLAAEWLARGISRAHLVRTLTANLPGHIHAPAAFTRKRLLTKCPPELPPAAQQHTSPTLAECANCGTPGRPEALPDGLCRPCQGSATPPPEPPLIHPQAAAARAAHQAGRARFLARPKRR
ncbi:hypothetical protein [Streptomyces griseocarneus]|uniref:hypothetical protein n=1 Tax=Streptomyces griseocarneus TaxID=51201 RepID=UPI00167DCF3C|nr:hypothetical protein [Streptomyces griseocarneus]MBZ6477665.1 hypothetical protein [Streptomyces griseocarneus]